MMMNLTQKLNVNISVELNNIVEPNDICPVICVISPDTYEYINGEFCPSKVAPG